MQWRGPKGSGSLTLGGVLGRGGEGSVLEVESITGGRDASGLVAKVYHDPSGRSGKLVEMLKNPVINDHIAWPLDLIAEEGQFKGYLMKRLDYDFYRPWSEVSHASTRRANASEFDYRYALYAALNLSYLLDSVHTAGHRIGDLNESNVLVGADATVSLVDTDSAQVGDHLCLVGKPEYTAPEIIGSFSENYRTIETDLYAYSVLVWQLLTGGTHPTDGEWTGSGEPPSVTDRIRRGDYPALGNFNNYRSLDRVPSEAVSLNLRTGLARLLALNPSDRGTTNNFRNILEVELENLKACDRVPSHWFTGEKCIWCERRDRGLNDPWGSIEQTVSSQQSLPSISFDTPEEEAPVRVSLQPALPSSSSASFAPGFSSGGQGFNNFSQSGGVSSASQGGVNAPVIPPVPEPEIPTKIKGKSVLTYSDGTWEVRPPLTVLARSNFKLALSCFFSEIPVGLKFWWGRHSSPGKIWALLLGLVAGFIVSGAWGLLTFLDLGLFPEFFKTFDLLKWLSVGSVVSSLVFVLIFFVSGLVFSLRNKQYVSEAWWKTVGRFVLIALFYGPLFVLIAIVFIFYLLVLLLLAMFRA